MISKLMIGRLGNQMFQYATIRQQQIKYYNNDKINLNFRLVYKEGNKNDGFLNQLTCFNLTEHYVDKPIKLNLYQKIIFFNYILYYKILKFFTKDNYLNKKREYELKIQNKLQKNGLFIFNYGFYDFKKTNKKDKLYVGFYESSKYFDDIKEELKKEFTPKYEKLEKNFNMYSIIENSNSVCVSIRCGDFLSDSQKKYHYVCTPKYFKDAIDEIKKKVKNPRFIIFSDDVEWVKNNLDLPSDSVYEDGTDPVWEKLRLMYSCKHFIISNSTFSWWAQYLSRNDDKVVVAPSRWKNDGFNDDIYQDNWIKINV